MSEIKTNLEEKSSQLSDQIWFTRKARIITTERLKHNHFHFNLILIWYSFLTFSISIYLIKKPNFFGDNSDVIMTLATGAVFTLSLFAPQLDLKSRYENIKKNYISLQGLIFELALVTTSEQILEINNKYIDLLHSVENHSTLDMYYFIEFESGNNCTKKLKSIERWKLYTYVVMKKITLLIAYLLPLSMVLIYV